MIRIAQETLFGPLFNPFTMSEAVLNVSQDASWQLPPSALHNVPCDIRPKEVERCRGEKREEREMMLDNRYRQTEMEFFPALHLLEVHVKVEKC